MTVRSWGTRARLAGGVALATAALAGCSAQSGAAAVVEDRVISVGDLHEATRELSPYLQDASPSAVLLMLVAEPVFERVAAEYGIAVSDAQARTALAEIAAASGEPAEFGDASVDVARLTILQQRLGELPDARAAVDTLTAELSDLDVEVNPRYGEIDFEEGTGISPVDRSWIVADAAP